MGLDVGFFPQAFAKVVHRDAHRRALGHQDEQLYLVLAKRRSRLARGYANRPDSLSAPNQRRVNTRFHAALQNAARQFGLRVLSPDERLSFRHRPAKQSLTRTNLTFAMVSLELH